MRCIIVDDDPLQRHLLESYVKAVEALSIVGAYESATQAMKAMQQGEVDLIFLDVEMPMMTGLDMLSALTNKPQVILVSAHEKYALPAFEYDVTDFLKKPIEFPRFLKAVSRATERLERKSAQRGQDFDLFVKDGTQLVRISTAEILYINALSDYVRIVTSGKDYAILYTMRALEEKLPKSKFLRVHRSYIIRLDKIDRIADHVIEIGRHSIPVSKSYREELYHRLNLLK
jgi:DNA-binding LytR/AlgR family response regulator